MTTAILGKWGEALAAEFLRKKKFKIVAANYRSRFGEIDLIAENKTHVVFVEVKLRKDERFAKACEFVNLSKQEKIRTTAELWLSGNPTEKEMRFDVVEIYAPNGVGGKYTINQIENAF
jgi:putative endonuclease